MSNNVGDGFFEEDSDDEEVKVPKKAKKRRNESSGTSKSKKAKPSLIDDAAEESGEEAGDPEDEEDDEEVNDYVRDGFVVDEDEDEVRKKKDDLEDSEDDDDEDEEEGRRNRHTKRVRKLRQGDVLDEDDLALISEFKGEREREETLAQERAEAAARKRETVVAKSEAELRKGLFVESDDDDDVPAVVRPKKIVAVERYDEDGMDDFIDDDIGDQGDIIASERRGGYDEEREGGVSEAQLNEASAIFGTDYLQFMGGDEREEDEDEDELMGRPKYREAGVGVDMGSDDEIMSDDDDDDLFGDEDDLGEGLTAHQKAEALRLRREKREMLKAERRRQAMQKKSEKRKALLRRAFEPVQLVENFCTEKDDEIRRSDIPERFFDWNTPFHGAETGPTTEDEMDEAVWIMRRIPAITSEFHSLDGNEPEEIVEKHQEQILDSIVHALRLMHCEKLEPSFIKRYRMDVVTSHAVRANLYSVMDEDAEWDRMLAARDKVRKLSKEMSSQATSDAVATAEDENIKRLNEELQAAQDKLEETMGQESALKEQLQNLDNAEADEDELFGGGDNEEAQKAKSEQRDRILAHLSTVQTLLETRTEKVSQISSQVQEAEAKKAEILASQGPILQVAKKSCLDLLWNSKDYLAFLGELSDMRNILDVHSFVNLVKEGNESIRAKETPSGGDGGKKSEARKRSRRFDRDFYRTCVGEGLRGICYKFLLSPHRVGIKLEDTERSGHFDFSKVLPGEESKDGAGNPFKWDAPTIPDSDPTGFANDLVNSGDLVLLSTSQGAEPDDNEARDPLRGCRYVAAMELAHEPRVRMHMRNIFRKHALLSTRPTKKGVENIDAFHDYYGLHLIKGKPVREHFPLDESEMELRKANLGPEERKELDSEMKKGEKNSCLQYLNILKAEQTGDITVHVHVPLREQSDEWFKEDVGVFANRENQDLSLFVKELEKVYLPHNGDSDEWNNERRKVIRLAILSFLLPQFEAEVRRDLREAAVKVGVLNAAASLKDMAMEGPYRPAALAATENRFLHPTGDLSVVGMCCSSDNKDASYLACVTERGELNDHLAIPSGTRIDSGKMRDKVITFLLQCRPSIVLVGTTGGFESRLMVRKLGEIVNEAVQQWNNRDIQREDEDDEEFETRQAAFRQNHQTSHLDDEDLEWKCNVDLVEDGVAQLFGRSIRGKKEFPDASVSMKCAIAIARHGKDPLAELAYAWSVASDAGVFGTEMLFLNIHPLQQLLPKTLLLRHYERVLCEVVSEVGVDVNTACTFDHIHGLLSLVPGLGPRKAANIRQSVTRLGGAVPSRRALLEKRLMGPVVYNNSVAFLRIREIEQLANQFLHPLDDTRLHPDVYTRNNWAVKIAIDALERMDEDTRNKESLGIKALRDVMENSGQEVERLFKATKQEWVMRFGPTFNPSDWDPRTDVPADQWRDKVEELDLDMFAQMIEQNGLGRWHSHLQMIKWEFRLPFADPRAPMKPLTGEKLFRLITGESDQSLRPGKEITGKIVRNGEFGSRVKLEGDIPAFIPLKNLADEHVESAEDIVTVGTVVTAIVMDVKKDHLSVDLSLKMEDFKKLPSSWERPESLPPLDHYFDRIAAARLEQQKSKEREARLEILQLSLGGTKIGDDAGLNDPLQTKRRSGRVTKRACAHPAFRNARQDEVDRELREAGDSMVGEALIRPSSKGKDSLAVHWVVRPGVIKVIEVQEEDKDTDASIGNILKIKNESYGSIDELLGRYIAPMNDYVEELVNHRKFLDLPEDDVDEKLREQKKATPSGVFYYLCWMEMHPGYASLRFILSSNPRSHHIGIAPNGYLWGSKVYTNLDKLLNDFKKNPRGGANSGISTKVESQTKVAESNRPSRWGAKPPAAPPAPPAWRPIPPPAPPQVPMQTNWAVPPAQVAAPPPGQWGVAPSGQWGQPPQLPPHPGHFQPPPPSGPPPMGQPPPPTFGLPPPGPPPRGPPPPGYPYRPPPPPGGPPPNPRVHR